MSYDQQSEARPNTSGDPQVPLQLQETALPPLTTKQTAQLAISFVLLWFIANWTLNAALELTSVASATILSTMSGMCVSKHFMVIEFSFSRGRVLHPWYWSIISSGETQPYQSLRCGYKVADEPLLFRFFLLADKSSFIGVILVSLSNSPLEQPLHLDPNALVLGAISCITLGNILALLSALFYAMYVILLKVCIKAEYRIDMQLFFGFVGLFNIVGCWPVGLIMHLTGAEIFELPHTKQVVYYILINV